MLRKLTTYVRRTAMLGATALVLGTTLATAGDGSPDDALSGWLGREFTIQASSVGDFVPVGGKMTFIYDSGDNVVRVCTRNVNGQRGAWKMDLAVPCGVELTFTRGTRYCTAEDVKAGNAEVLSACHRLRSHDVAMHPSAVKGAVELNDMIVFLVPAENGKHAISVLVDSPARVTDGGTFSGRD